MILAEFDTREVAELPLEWLVTAEGSSYTSADAIGPETSDRRKETLMLESTESSVTS